MDAIIMPSTHYVIENIRKDFPDISFVKGREFSWSINNKTIEYSDNGDSWPMLLHEIAHSLLNHNNYKSGIHLLNMERDAWIKAEELASNYDLTIDEEIIEKSLDTYRDWLHSRSKCPECGAIGFETEKYIHHCLECNNDWKVNDARMCRLRRDRIKK
jgi:Mlc titration factor MtfA (ptsG expression regulator)